MRETYTHVYFWAGMYSNWDNAHFIDPLNSLHFHNTEQAFMWYKAHFFQDKQTAQLISVETDPKAVKGLGRRIDKYDDKAWSCVRFGMMVYVNYLKFSQNPYYMQALKLTENKTLVEASPSDCVWGVGLAEEDDLILNQKNWRGQNLLGKALMEVRKLL